MGRVPRAPSHYCNNGAPGNPPVDGRATPGRKVLLSAAKTRGHHEAYHTCCQEPEGARLRDLHDRCVSSGAEAGCHRCKNHHHSFHVLNSCRWLFAPAQSGSSDEASHAGRKEPERARLRNLDRGARISRGAHATHQQCNDRKRFHFLTLDLVVVTKRSWSRATAPWEENARSAPITPSG